MKQFSRQGQHHLGATLYMITRTVLLLFFSLSFSIQDLSAQFPQDFEGASFPPAGWTSFIGTNGLGTAGNWERAFDSGSNKAVKKSEFIQEAEDWLVTTQFTPTAADHVLSFSQHETFFGDNGNTFSIRISTASQTNHGDFTSILVFTELDIDSYLSFLEVDLSAYVDIPIYVAFVTKGIEQWNIDNVDLGPAATSANDECSLAIMLPINSDLNCTNFQSGTLLGATNSTIQASCSIPLNSDVWYTFVATSPYHQIQLFNISPINSGYSHLMQIQLLEGANCGNLAELRCYYESSIDNRPGFAINGLMIGSTYYVRVAYLRPLPVSVSFDICIGTPPPPPENDLCTDATMLTVNPDLNCAATSPGTFLGATASISDAGCSLSRLGIWYSFVATSANLSILCQNIIGDDYFIIELSAGTDCENLTQIECWQYGEGFIASGLIIGQKYYLHIFDDNQQSTTFDVCISTLPPAPPNDECTNATTLTVNTNQSCEHTTSGTIAGAAPSSLSARVSNARGGGCSDGFDDDVWYKFVAVSSQADIQFTNIAGSTTDLQYEVRQGTACGSLSFVPNLGCFNILTDMFSATGLTAGNTYYIRVSSSSYSIAQTTTFDICIQSCEDNDMDYLTCDDLCPDVNDVSLYFRDDGDFAGNTSDYVAVPHHPDFNLTDGDFAFEAWVYPTSGDYKTIVSKGHGGNAFTQYIFQIIADNDNFFNQPGKLGLFLGDQVYAEWQFSNTSIPQDVWSHVAVSLDLSDFEPIATFYLNGQPDGVKTYSDFSIDFFPLYNFDTNPFYIGRQGHNCACNFFEGRIDELAVWDRTLTPADLAASMAAPYSGNESGLVAYYDFNDAAACGSSLVSTSLFDKASIHDGSLINFLTWIDSNNPCRSNWAPGHNRGACEAGCPYNLNLSGTQPSDFDHSSSNNIHSNQVIDSPAQVGYDAQMEISLLQGFEVKIGASFHAYINGCSNVE